MDYISCKITAPLLAVIWANYLETHVVWSVPGHPFWDLNYALFRQFFDTLDINEHDDFYFNFI